MKGTKIVVTYNCNIMCSHCIYKCGPHKKGIMSVESFTKAATQAYSSSCNEYIFVAGGEPFLHSGIIYKYFKNISSINIRKDIITNGYWGNIEPSMEILLDFRNIGLNGVIIEYDYFHSIFIDVDTIKNAIYKCIKAGLNVTLKSLFITNNMTDIRDAETFKFIKEIKNKFCGINLEFELFDKGTENRLFPLNNEKIILYK